VPLIIDLNEETAWAIGNFNHRSRWKGSHHVGISLNNRNLFGKDDIHDPGEGTTWAKRYLVTIRGTATSTFNIEARTVRS
jgi:hypothetical protein